MLQQHRHIQRASYTTAPPMIGVSHLPRESNFQLIIFNQTSKITCVGFLGKISLRSIALQKHHNRHDMGHEQVFIISGPGNLVYCFPVLCVWCCVCVECLFLLVISVRL